MNDAETIAEKEKPKARRANDVINEEIERLRLLYKANDGTVDDAAVKVDLGTWYRNHVELFDPDSVARQKYSQYVDARGMWRKNTNNVFQPTLPDLDSIMQLGDDHSVLLRDARRSHLVKRRTLILEGFSAQAIAHARERRILDTALERIRKDDDTYEVVMASEYSAALVPADCAAD